MGRRRNSDFHLPPRMRLKHGAYHYTPRVNGKQKCIHRSRDYAEALARWAEHQGREGNNNGLISGMIDRFIRPVLPSYASKTKEGYLRYGGDLRNVFGDVAIDDLKPHEIATHLRRSTHKVQANRQIAYCPAYTLSR